VAPTSTKDPPKQDDANVAAAAPAAAAAPTKDPPSQDTKNTAAVASTATKDPTSQQGALLAKHTARVVWDQGETHDVTSCLRRSHENHIIKANHGDFIRDSELQQHAHQTPTDTMTDRKEISGSIHHATVCTITDNLTTNQGPKAKGPSVVM
jgi:hypothetical protein